MAQEDLLKPFKEFAVQGGDYYARTFLAIQQSKLGRYHINWAAALGGFIWASMRGNWLLFWIAFLIDLVVVVNLGTMYRYSTASVEVAARVQELLDEGKDALAQNKAFLLERYEGWIDSSLFAALFILLVGHLLFGWIADRIYYFQYNKWRVNAAKASGLIASRLVWTAVILALIAPLMLYRSTQFPPEARDCVKQYNALQAGEDVAFKARFDCWTISEFPTLFWFQRPDKVSYPRNDDGTRSVKRDVAPPTAKPVNLFNYASQQIDQGILYATVFYSSFFDSITAGLRSLLSGITAVFVGTPWPIVMGTLIGVSYYMAGRRVTIFVASSLGYLALFGLWQDAMDTLSLVIASTIVCVLGGLPLGIWVGKSARGKSVMTPILDIMQTIPSFVYLLPAVAFFGTGKPPGILATVIFAMPPMVRLVALGIQHVPESTKEAALAFGANPRQLLVKVELPLALPSIMAGVNQVVMMSLSMVVVAALIGAGGLGQIVTRALASSDSGKGILAGIGIALLAMMIDRVVQRSTT